VVTLEDLPEYLVRRPPGHLSGLWTPHATPPPIACLDEVVSPQDPGAQETKKVLTFQTASSDMQAYKSEKRMEADPVEFLRDALRQSGWNMSAAARRLGVSRMTLYRRMERLGLSSPNKKDGLVGDGDSSKE
jgi:transcriptional regulator of acetoin/glycerol metabolism